MSQGKIVGTEKSLERHLFAKWLRRVMRQKGMRFVGLRENLGVDGNTFNRWMIDVPRGGTPLVPTDDECKMIASMMGVRDEFVLRLAQRTRDALNDTVVVIKTEDGTIVKKPVPVVTTRD